MTYALPASVPRFVAVCTAFGPPASACSSNFSPTRQASRVVSFPAESDHACRYHFAEQDLPLHQPAHRYQSCTCALAMSRSSVPGGFTPFIAAVKLSNFVPDHLSPSPASCRPSKAAAPAPSQCRLRPGYPSKLAGEPVQTPGPTSRSASHPCARLFVFAGYRERSQRLNRLPRLLINQPEAVQLPRRRSRPLCFPGTAELPSHQRVR